MKKSEMEKEMLDLLRRPGAYLVLPADMTLEQAAEMRPEHLLTALVEDRKPREGWEPEEPELPERLVLVWVTPPGNERVPYLVPAQRSWRGDEDRDNGFRAARDAYNSENRYMRVVERALAEVRRPATTFERILAILEEREPAPAWTGASEDPAFNVPLPPDQVERRRDLPQEHAPESFSWSAWKAAEDEEWIFNRVLGAVEVLSDTSIKGSERIAKALAILTGRKP